MKSFKTTNPNKARQISRVPTIHTNVFSRPILHNIQKVSNYPCQRVFKADTPQNEDEDAKKN